MKTTMKMTILLLLAGCATATAETITLAEACKDPSLMARVVSPSQKEVAWMCRELAVLEAGVAKLDEDVKALERKLDESVRARWGSKQKGQAAHSEN
jgi:uncharacterized protein YceK